MGHVLYPATGEQRWELRSRRQPLRRAPLRRAPWTCSKVRTFDLAGSRVPVTWSLDLGDHTSVLLTARSFLPELPELEARPSCL